MKFTLNSLVQSYHAISLDSDIQKLDRALAYVQKYFDLTETEMGLLPIAKIRERLKGEILRRAIDEKRAGIIDAMSIGDDIL